LRLGEVAVIYMIGIMASVAVVTVAATLLHGF
jgi:hypothetical protein